MREIKYQAWNPKLKILKKSGFSINPQGKIYDINGALQKDWALREYAGLKDKNGIEIYEGDIVLADCREGHNENQSHYIIEYDSTNCLFYGNPNKCKVNKFKNTYHCYGMSELRQNIEIIGNIYENKELLGE